MNKADIADKIYENIGITKREAIDIVEMVLEIMKRTLESGEKVKVAGFGNFEVKKKSDRRGRNPQTGEALIIDARRILTFKPSHIFKDKINTEKGEVNARIN